MDWFNSSKIVAEFWPTLFREEEMPTGSYRDFIYTHSAAQFAQKAIPKTLIETFNGGYPYQSVGGKFLFTPKISLDNVHAILDKERILDAISLYVRHYVGEFVDGVRSHTSNSLQWLFPKFIRPFSLSDYARNIDIVLATREDYGKAISECVSTPLYTEGNTVINGYARNLKPIINPPSMPVDTTSINDSVRKAFDAWENNKDISELLEETKCDDGSNGRTEDVLGYYHPQFSHIVIFIDMIDELPHSHLAFQKVLLHEYIHALLDWRTRMILPEDEEIVDNFRGNEETLDNMLVLYTYSCAQDKVCFNIVKYLMAYQPECYRRAVTEYNRIATSVSHELEAKLHDRALRHITLRDI